MVLRGARSNDLPLTVASGLSLQGVTRCQSEYYGLHVHSPPCEAVCHRRMNSAAESEFKVTDATFNPDRFPGITAGCGDPTAQEIIVALMRTIANILNTYVHKIINATRSHVIKP